MLTRSSTFLIYLFAAHVIGTSCLGQSEQIQTMDFGSQKLNIPGEWKKEGREYRFVPARKVALTTATGTMHFIDKLGSNFLATEIQVGSIDDLPAFVEVSYPVDKLTQPEIEKVVKNEKFSSMLAISLVPKFPKSLQQCNHQKKCVKTCPKPNQSKCCRWGCPNR